MLRISAVCGRSHHGLLPLFFFSQLFLAGFVRILQGIKPQLLFLILLSDFLREISPGNTRRIRRRREVELIVERNPFPDNHRSEEHTLNSSHVAISYAVFCLKKKK